MSRAKMLERKGLGESEGAPVGASSDLNKSLQPNRLTRIAVGNSRIQVQRLQPSEG